MSRFSHTSQDTALAAIAADITHVSLHSSYPDNTGAGEISGGSPAYARQALVTGWTPTSISGGQATQNTDALTFDVPAGTSVAFMGFWDAASAGNFLGYGALGDFPSFPCVVDPTGERLVSPGTTGTQIDNIGLTLADQRVYFRRLHVTPFEATTPVAGTIYFVRDLGTPPIGGVLYPSFHFAIAATAGGAALNLSNVTGPAPLIAQRVAVETFGSQGQLVITTKTLRML